MVLAEERRESRGRLGGMNVDTPIHLMSLCAGLAGGDLGIRLAIPSARTVVFVEIEAYCIEVLVSAMENGLLDAAPVWTDLRTFDGRPWRGRVHCILAGYPCQPFSAAGKRLGERDPRHLWPEVRRIISEVEPPLVFLENVANHLRLGFDIVRGELQAMGYLVEAGLFSAEEVGASQERCRLFALAYRFDRRWDSRESVSGVCGLREGWRRSEDNRRELDGSDDGQPHQQQSQVRPTDSRATTGRGVVRLGGSGRELADPRHGLIPLAGAEPQGGDGAGSGGEELGRNARRGLGELREPSGGDGQFARGGVPFPFPPHRTGDWERWAYVLDRWPWLRPALSRFDRLHIAARLAGIPGVGPESTPVQLGRALCAARHAPETYARFRCLVDGLADLLERNRTDRLRAIGNGIVPLCAAWALVTLAERAGIGEWNGEQLIIHGQEVRE